MCQPHGLTPVRWTSLDPLRTFAVGAAALMYLGGLLRGLVALGLG